VKKSNQIFIATLTFVAMLNSGCGNGLLNGVSSAPTSLSGFPRATDGSASTSLSGSSSRVNLAGVSKATTGAKVLTFASAFGTGTPVVATSSQSRAFCEVGQSIKAIYQNAAMPDIILCEMAVLDKFGILTNAYDGNNHYLTVTGSSTGNIKYQVSKKGLAVNGFTLYSCSANNGTTQDTYMNASVTDNGVTLSGVNVFSGSGFSGS